MVRHEKLIAVPPDGGWGWVILAICFYADVVIHVPPMGFQVIQPHLIKLLKMSAPEVSVIFSTYTMSMYLAGPFGGGICNRFGFRTTSIIGSIIMLCGLCSSYFVQHYALFIILFGVVGGTGGSMVLMMACVAPGFWFESKRAIAMGLSASGSGFSIFTVSLSKYVADELGWRYCFLLWACMLFVLLLGSTLLAPPPMVELAGAVHHDEEIDLDEINAIHPVEYDIDHTQRLVEKKVKKMTKVTGLKMGETTEQLSVMPEEEEAVGMGRWCKWCLCCAWCKQTVGSRPLYRKDIFYQGNIAHAAEVEDTHTEAFTLAMTKLPTSKEIRQEVECHCKIPQAVTRGISEMIDFSLFKSGIFLLLMFSSISMYIVRYVPFLILKRVNLPHMSEKMAAMLVSLMGMGAFVARICGGFVLYYFKNISALSACIALSVVGGLFLLMIPLNHNLVYQIITCFFGGALPAVLVSLRSIAIIDLLGLDKLTSSTGILFFVQGVASFIGMPVAELMNQSFGTVEAGMYFSGFGYLVCSSFLIVIHFIALKRDQDAEKE